MLNRSVVTDSTVIATGLERKHVTIMSGRIIKFNVRPIEIKSIFSLDTDRSAQGIQTKNRIGATDQVHRVNGSFGDKIPINSISKHLIHTNAILIDG